MQLVRLSAIVASILAASLLNCSITASARAAQDQEQQDDRLDWWREARFGMFVHWGLYAVPGGVWEGERIGGTAEWIMRNGRIPVEDYQRLLHAFNPVLFDAEEWVRILKDAGMKYLVITTKHHDGFALFDSEVSDYDIMATPFKRDIMKELVDACRAEGIRIGWYHSILDWHHSDYLPRLPWDDRPAEDADYERFVEYLHAQVEEIMTNYGPIDIMWFDGEWEATWTHEHGIALYDHCLALNPEGIINNRVDKGRQGMQGLTREGDFRGDFGTPEQEIPPTGLPGMDWETCMTMNDTWGYNRYDDNWKSAETLIRNLIDIVSKGGNYLLNVGPDALGEIPLASQQRLEAIGDWMDVNGESIYGTQASPFRRLDFGRATRKTLHDGAAASHLLYVHIFDWPEDGVLRLPGLKTAVRSARFLDPARGDGDLRIEARDTGDETGDVLVHVGEVPGDHAAATVIVLELDGPAEVEPFSIRERDGEVTLAAADALLQGGLRLEHRTEEGNIGYWLSADDRASWEFTIVRDGTFEVRITQAAPAESAGTPYGVRIDDDPLNTVAAAAQSTGDWSRFSEISIGRVELTRGTHTLTIQPREQPAHALLNLSKIVLRRVD